MKKNVVGNIIAPNRCEQNIFKRLDLLPRLLCLLLAVIIWLLVVNFHEPVPGDPHEDLAGITEVVP